MKTNLINIYFFILFFSGGASQLQGPGFDSWLGGLSVWSLHVVPVLVWVFTGQSSFLPLSKDMLVRLIGLSKLPSVCVSVVL